MKGASLQRTGHGSVRRERGIWKGASISACGNYRWVLVRTWNDRPYLVFVMLNPSTADARDDDATIRVCMGRARRMKCGGIVVVNLFAYRATDPKELRAAEDPVGSDNDFWISQATSTGAHMIIAGWGDGGKHLDRAAVVQSLCRVRGVPLYHLGLTKSGQPRHPLRVSYATRPKLWSAR